MRKDYIIINCKTCGDDMEIWKYDLTRKNPHSGNCRSCATKLRSANMIASTDRDTIFLRKQLRNIKSRCSGKYENYKSYTVKGVSVCAEWDKQDTFVEWAKSNGWEYGLTIDRIDNDGNYEPNNCRWITNKRNILESEVSRVSRGVSKYIGVWFRHDINTWTAEIQIDKKKISLGIFPTEDDACVYRDLFLDRNNIPYLKRNNIDKVSFVKSRNSLRDWSTEDLTELIFDYNEGETTAYLMDKYSINRNMARVRALESASKHLSSRKYIYP